MWDVTGSLGDVGDDDACSARSGVGDDGVRMTDVGGSKDSMAELDVCDGSVVKCGVECSELSGASADGVDSAVSFAESVSEVCVYVVYLHDDNPYSHSPLGVRPTVMLP